LDWFLKVNRGKMSKVGVEANPGLAGIRLMTMKLPLSWKGLGPDESAYLNNNFYNGRNTV